MINVIGLGYIGLPTALMMASHGVEVIGTDYNKQLVDTLNAGKTTFKEKGLDELFRNALEAGIRFTTEYQKTDMYIVSVPTPYDKFSKKVDACYVVEAVKDVMKVCPKGATVVIESTVSPGTIDKFVRPIIEGNGFVIGEDINLVHALKGSSPATWCTSFSTTTARSARTTRKSARRSRNITQVSARARSSSPTSAPPR